MTGKRLRKITQQSFLMFCMLKKWKHVQLYISKIDSNCEKQINLILIQKKRKRRLALPCSKNTICIIEKNSLKK